MTENLKRRIEKISLNIEPKDRQKSVAQIAHENLQKSRRVLDKLDVRDLGKIQYLLSESNLRAYATFRIHAIHEDQKFVRHTGYEFDEMLQFLKELMEVMGHDAWVMLEPKKKEIMLKNISVPKPPPLPNQPLGKTTPPPLPIKKNGE